MQLLIDLCLPYTQDDEDDEDIYDLPPPGEEVHMLVTMNGRYSTIRSSPSLLLSLPNAASMTLY